LTETLRRIDGAGYNAYRDIEACWEFQDGMKLMIDRVQSDPFAAPSRARVSIPMRMAGFPGESFSTPTRKIALCDYLTRIFHGYVKRGGHDVHHGSNGNWHGEKGGEMTVDAPGQHVIERTSVLVSTESVEVRFTVALPARS